VRRRRRAVSVEAAAVAYGAPTWAQVANPRENFANRWAMYEDLTARAGRARLVGQDRGEFGGTNEVLRAFMHGAEHRLFLYPEYDIQDLGKVPDSVLDVAVLDQTLEHVPDPERALREVRRVLRSRGMAIVTTPFLVPVHAADTYGDYYRWTPQGMMVMLRRCGFMADVHMWGNRAAAAALLEDMYMTAAAATGRGLGISFQESDPIFPVTVWALAEKTS
jgi:SAM-dependent methyltransferase